MRNYYEILELTPQATIEDIKKAYRKLARKYHPDHNPDDKQAEEMFKMVSHAYQVLSEENTRQAYDNHLNNSGRSASAQEAGQPNYKSAETFDGFGAMDFESMKKTFENFFGFSPKDNNPKSSFNRKKSKENKKNPLDTSAAFESFFKMKKN